MVTKLTKIIFLLLWGKTMFNGAIGYKCSICGIQLERDVFGDAQRHLTSHCGIYAELIPIFDDKKNSALKHS